jgi:hypothetical protein
VGEERPSREAIISGDESLLVRTEELEDEPLPHLPLMHSVRLIVGVFCE